jgi:hypothetical protein
VQQEQQERLDQQALQVDLPVQQAQLERQEQLDQRVFVEQQVALAQQAQQELHQTLKVPQAQQVLKV